MRLVFLLLCLCISTNTFAANTLAANTLAANTFPANKGAKKRPALKTEESAEPTSALTPKKDLELPPEEPESLPVVALVGVLPPSRSALEPRRGASPGWHGIIGLRAGPAFSGAWGAIASLEGGFVYHWQRMALGASLVPTFAFALARGETLLAARGSLVGHVALALGQGELRLLVGPAFAYAAFSDQVGGASLRQRAAFFGVNTQLRYAHWLGHRLLDAVDVGVEYSALFGPRPLHLGALTVGYLRRF